MVSETNKLLELSMTPSGTPVEHQRNTSGTPVEHRWNTSGTPVEHQRNTVGTPVEHHLGVGMKPGHLKGRILSGMAKDNSGQESWCRPRPFTQDYD